MMLPLYFLSRIASSRKIASVTNNVLFMSAIVSIASAVIAFVVIESRSRKDRSSERSWLRSLHFILGVVTLVAYPIMAICHRFAPMLKTRLSALSIVIGVICCGFGVAMMPSWLIAPLVGGIAFATNLGRAIAVDAKNFVDDECDDDKASLLSKDLSRKPTMIRAESIPPPPPGPPPPEAFSSLELSQIDIDEPEDFKPPLPPGTPPDEVLRRRTAKAANSSNLQQLDSSTFIPPERPPPPPPSD